MSVTLIIKIEHAADGSLQAVPEIKAKANDHCACEMAFAMAIAKSAAEFAAEFSTPKAITTHTGEPHNVH